jgi:hypothetical protein
MTPRPTKIALGTTLALTVATLTALGHTGGDGALLAEDVAPLLWILTGLFVLRVVGQVLVALRAPSWLPPMSDWNLTPYRLLLPTQIFILAVMAWIDLSVSRGAAGASKPGDTVGLALIVLGAAYAAAMALRYIVRMARTPEARWFGGTIPIVFHVVLATYLVALGSLYGHH